ncbi:MAG: hypothetical protein ABIS30_09955 [Gallionella sp.]
MSINDHLPWIPPTRDILLLGHWHGGQLIFKALGATVSRTPTKEISYLNDCGNDLA